MKRRPPRTRIAGPSRVRWSGIGGISIAFTDNLACRAGSRVNDQRRMMVAKGTIVVVVLAAIHLLHPNPESSCTVLIRPKYQ